MTTPADWEGFAEVVGAASGALTGLLFVAVSLNATRIAGGHRGLRASAAQTLVLFLQPLAMALILLTPGQSDAALGGELIAAGLLASWSLIGIGRMKHGLTDDDLLLIRIFNRRATNILVMLLFVVGGAVLASGEDAGLYLLLPATLVAFISGVLNLVLPPPAPARPPGGAQRVPPPGTRRAAFSDRGQRLTFSSWQQNRPASRGSFAGWGSFSSPASSG